jgi:cytochrome P450
MKTPPMTDTLDVVRLLGRSLGGFLMRPFSFDFGSVFCYWMRAVMERHQSRNVIVNLLGKKVLLVSGHDLSAHILSQYPCSHGYLEGQLKSKAMSFLAPNALTICHDEQWACLRTFTEQVLCAGETHIYQRAFLGTVRNAFSSPVSNVEDIRRGMGQAMLGIVFGDSRAPTHLAKDIEVLFGLVQSPVKRLALGFWEKGRREKFYNTLRKMWEESKEDARPSLLSLAHKAAGKHDETELIQQVPHWMFTFTGSGTDLLTRTLAVVTSRPAVRARISSEIAEHGPLDEPATIGRLVYLEACLLESARLFSPVPRTFHRAPQGDTFNELYIPAGMEIAHYFPLNQRNHDRDPSADHFQPDRWLDPASAAHAMYPNLFLSGARACPGKNLILFVCKSAIAILLKEHNLQAESVLLATDPLPFSWPEKEIHFHT